MNTSLRTIRIALEQDTVFGQELAFLVPQMVNNLPAIQETRVQSLGWEDPLQKGNDTHSSIPAWRIPCTEESGGLQSMGSQRDGHNWATNILDFPGDSVAKNLPANVGDAWDIGSIPRSGRSPGEGNGNPLQYSCLENPMDRGLLSLGLQKLDTTEWLTFWSLQVALVVENPPANAGDIRDMGSIPASGRSPGGGQCNSLQYSCLENPVDRGPQSTGLQSVEHDWSNLAQWIPELTVNRAKSASCQHRLRH